MGESIRCRREPMFISTADEKCRTTVSAMDDWYLEMVKRKNKPVQSVEFVPGDLITQTLKRSGSFTVRGQVVSDSAKGNISSGSQLISSGHITGDRTVCQQSSTFGKMKKASTDSRILSSNQNALTLTQWYDNEPFDSSLHGSQVLSETSSHSHDLAEAMCKKVSSLSTTVDISATGQHAVDVMAQEIAVAVRLQEKIRRTSELLKKEQEQQQNSVNEYLQLSESINPADRDKVTRVKAAFERRNQKSAAAVVHYKKKLDSYELKLKQLNESSFVNGSYTLPSTGVNPSPFFRGLRHVSTNVRSGISGFSGTFSSKPKVLAHMLSGRYGSADNISTIRDAMSPQLKTMRDSIRYHSEEDMTKLQLSPGETNQGVKFDRGSSSRLTVSSQTGISMGCTLGLAHENIQRNNNILSELGEELIQLQSKLQNSKEDWMRKIQCERTRYDILEEKMSEMSENRNSDITCFKDEVAVLEEKISYHLEERVRDMMEIVDACNSRLQKLEGSQQGDVMNSSHFSQSVVLLMNAGLAIIAIVLVIINFFKNLLQPFVSSRSWFIISMGIAIVAFMVWFGFDGAIKLFQ